MEVRCFVSLFQTFCVYSLTCNIAACLKSTFSELFPILGNVLICSPTNSNIRRSLPISHLTNLSLLTWHKDCEQGQTASLALS